MTGQRPSLDQTAAAMVQGSSGLESSAEPGSHSSESLVDYVGRAKARWLRRIVYDPRATSTQKCFAYAVFDHLNCVTLDCWPSQARLATLLGFDSTKTLQRAARGLEEIGALKIKGGGRSGYRYEPVLMPGDADRNVPKDGHLKSRYPDSNVSESFLPIHIKSDARQTAADQPLGVKGLPDYDRRKRGTIEIEIAAALGPNGIEVLSRLGQLDDAIVERLCRAYFAGALGERELMAARLAAEQVR